MCTFSYEKHMQSTNILKYWSTKCVSSRIPGKFSPFAPLKLCEKLPLHTTHSFQAFILLCCNEISSKSMRRSLRCVLKTNFNTIHARVNLANPINKLLGLGYLYLNVFSRQCSLVEDFKKHVDQTKSLDFYWVFRSKAFLSKGYPAVFYKLEKELRLLLLINVIRHVSEHKVHNRFDVNYTKIPSEQEWTRQLLAQTATPE